MEEMAWGKRQLPNLLILEKQFSYLRVEVSLWRVKESAQGGPRGAGYRSLFLRKQKWWEGYTTAKGDAKVRRRVSPQIKISWGGEEEERKEKETNKQQKGNQKNFSILWF